MVIFTKKDSVVSTHLASRVGVEWALCPAVDIIKSHCPIGGGIMITDDFPSPEVF